MKPKNTHRRNMRAAALWAVVILVELAAAAIPAAAAVAFLLPLGFKVRGEAAFGVEWLIITLLYCALFTAIHCWFCDKIFEEG